MSDSLRGRFLWYELLTSDPDAAEAFYSRVLGWGTETWEGRDKPYLMWTVDGEAVAGRLPLPDDAQAPPHWLAYVGVPDLPAGLRQARDLGATPLFGPHDIQGVGTIAVIADPQGAAIALLQPADDPPPTPQGTGRVAWHELATADADAALDFYTRLFGWLPHSEHDMGEGWIYHMLRHPDHDNASIAIFRKPDEMPASVWLYYVEVDDVDAAAVRLRDAGGQVVVGPMDVPGGGRIAQCTDPQGAFFALTTRPQ